MKSLSEQIAESLKQKFPYLKKIEGRNKTRELTRCRDNFICQFCGKKWKEGQRRFDVHHLDCEKEKTRQYDKIEELSNLITLCHKCHLNIPEHKKTMQQGWLKSHSGG